MKIETYLINLDGSTARLASAKEQLDAAGWAFKRYAAYDGRGKNIRDFTNYDDRQAKKYWAAVCLIQSWVAISVTTAVWKNSCKRMQII